MIAKGSFDVQLSPQEDTAAPAGRMVIQKTYQGDLVGTASGQMLSKRTEGGAAAYFAVEEVSGTVGGKTGGFTLLHRGSMNKDSQSLEVLILEGSGTGQLEGIGGSMTIIQHQGGHQYELEYHF